MKKIIFLLLFSSLLTLIGCDTDRVIYVDRPVDGVDATPIVLEALEKCRKTKAKRLVFETGSYTFLSKLAPERYLFISNNDPGLKRVAIDLTGIEDLEIDGQKSDFMFYGYIVPFLLDSSKNITIRNLSFDFHRPFHSEGLIVEAYRDSLDIQFTDEYPYYVENGKLMFTGHEYVDRDCGGKARKEPYPFWHLLEFNAKKREPVTGKEYLSMQTMPARELNPGLVRISSPGLTGTKGNTMVFNPEFRYIPGIVVTDSKNTQIKNVTIYHAGAMGVVGQRSKDIFIDSLKVIAPEGRMVSTTADATHFVHCRGKITIQNSLFESMMDDATNIHGVYMNIDQILSPTKVLVKRVHYQQYGFDIFAKTSNVEIVHSPSMNTIAENKIKSVENLNKEYIVIELMHPLEREVNEGDAIAVTDDKPEVLFTKSIVRKNRARGMLLGSRGRTVIEDNYFHTHTHAITLEGDANFWYEQAGVNDLIIRNNTFDGCNYSVMFGLGIIYTGAGIAEEEKPNSRYNRNILIENNRFILTSPCILNLYSVDNLTYRNNTVEESQDSEYKLPEWVIPYMEANNIGLFDIKHSSNINIEE